MLIAYGMPLRYDRYKESGKAVLCL